MEKKVNKKLSIKETTVNSNLCIACGLCVPVCPTNAISMHWGKKLSWTPLIDDAKCTNCGLCTKTCPNTPERICEYAVEAAKKGECFGLQNNARYFIAYDLNQNNRIRSASGGALNVILKYLLEKGEIDGVIASVPVLASIGEPHYAVKILKSIKELDDSRSSHYYPLRYDKVLQEVSRMEGKFAITGTPCIIRGIKKLPDKIRKKIRFTFCLVCSHNVTGQFLDCLARKEGIVNGEPFIANLRDKLAGITDAGNYNNYFKLANREIRRNRFQTAFTDMWRNYFFAHESCLYCPDFYGVDADLSVKDAWGRLSKDPLGISLLVVRHTGLAEMLEQVAAKDKLFLKSCDSDEVFNSQAETARFKHIKIRDRLVWKFSIRRELIKNNYLLGTSRRYLKAESRQYWRYRLMMFLSNFFYSRTDHVPEGKIIKLAHLEKSIIRYLRNKFQRFVYVSRKILSPVKYITKPFFRHFPTFPLKNKNASAFRVLIAGGYGYKNTGDEAQLSTVISHWKRIYPNVKLTILSPNPDYTQREHGEYAELAPRVTLFNSDKNSDYGSSNVWFRWRYQWIKYHMLFLAWLYRKGFPLVAAYPHEIHLLNLIAQADVFHLSGGGYLTGMTLSRLWENMLLIRVADLLDTPVILSGHTIGIFKDKTSKRIARWGLEKARLIYLRDPEDSMAEVHSLGIKGPHVKSTFDDALFCEIAIDKTIDECLEENEIGALDKYAVVNIHYWGQSPSNSRRVMERCAEVCDYFVSTHNLRVVFIPMHPSDVASMKEVQSKMSKESRVIEYNYDYRLTRGIISRARLCLTMKHHTIVFALGTGVPTIAIALDDYYLRKNQGALKLFAQEDWMVDWERLFSKGALEHMIDNCLNNSLEIRRTILSHLEDKKGEDGEVVRRFVELLCLGEKSRMIPKTVSRA